MALSSGQKCYSKVTQYDVGNFPLFTHDLHTWQQFSPGSWVVVYDEWIQQQTWYEWGLSSNTEGHYALAYDTVESWANSHYSSSAPSPFFFFDAWPYMRNDITWFGSCYSNTSSLDYEQFFGIQHLWYRNKYN